jgi:outer membrane lipoprotein-sorting protein
MNKKIYWILNSDVLKFSISLLVVMLPFITMGQADQTAEQLIQKVKEKLDKVNDYEAKGTMKTNVAFIKAPVAKVKVYFKKPNKLRINNESGISFVPKGSMNINLGTLFVAGATSFDIIDMGKETGSNLRVIKLLPKDEAADIVLSTLYIDEATLLVRKAKTTTRENGTFELEMTYGKYADYALASKIVFAFNTKDYKLPKGVTFDYDDGKKPDPNKLKNKKGKVELHYNSYTVNQGVPDSVFQ